jgi:hypothetical protein
MWVIVSLAVATFVIWRVIKSRSRKTALPKVRARPTPRLEVAERLAKIKSKRDFEQLQHEIERLENTDYKTGAANDRANAKLEFLREVEGWAWDTTIGCQLQIEGDIGTPLSTLQYAFKVVKPDDPIFANGKSVEWVDLGLDDLPETVPTWVEPLKRLRAVIESDATLAEKIRRIDAAYAKHADALEPIFDPEPPLSAGLAWRADDLAEQGLPKAAMLVAEGVVTDEDVLKIVPDEFEKRKGVGSKSKAALVEFQERLRAAKTASEAKDRSPPSN